MSAQELLVERATEYELRAASCVERAEMEPEKQLDQAALGFASVAMALREVAAALREDE